MLGNAGPLDASLVHEWMKLDWQTAYPGVGYATLRESLLQHLDALLTEPLPPVQLDGELVAKARGTFASVPMAQRVYSRIRPSAAAQRIPAWRPDEALGPAGVGLFVRASGKRLSDGIPGFFTVDGFHKVLLPSLGTAAKSVMAESWVLGERIEFDPNGPQMRALERDVIALYEADYAPAWDLMLADLNVVQLRSLSQAAQDLYTSGIAAIADAKPARFDRPSVEFVRSADAISPCAGCCNDRQRGIALPGTLWSAPASLFHNTVAAGSRNR